LTRSRYKANSCIRLQQGSTWWSRNVVVLGGSAEENLELLCENAHEFLSCSCTGALDHWYKLILGIHELLRGWTWIQPEYNYIIIAFVKCPSSLSLFWS